MNLIELIFKANTSGLKDAQRELKATEKATEKVEQQTGSANAAFKDLGSVKGPIGEVTSKVGELQGAIGNVAGAARALPALLIAAVSAAGILAAVRFAGPLDDLGDLATKLGMGVNQLTLLKQSLEGSGLSVETYSTSIDKVVKALSKTDEEGSKAALAIGELGVKVSDASTPQEVLAEVTAKYFDRVQDGTVTVGEYAALQVVLGKNVRETMVAVEAAEEAQKRYNHFTELGIGITQSGADAASDYEKSSQDLSFILTAMGSQLVGSIIPAFTSLQKWFVKSYESGGLVYGAFQLLKAGAELLMVPIRAIISLFIALDNVVTIVSKSLMTAFKAFGQAATGDFAGAWSTLSSIQGMAIETLKAGNEEIANLWKDSIGGGGGPLAAGGGVPGTLGGGLGANNKNRKKEKPFFPGDATGPFNEWKMMMEERAKRDLENIARYDKAEAAANAAYESEKKFAEAVRDTLDPTRELNREIEKINNNILLNAPEKEEAIKRLKENFDKTKKGAEELNLGLEASKYVAGQVGDALSNAFTAGTFSFKNFLVTLLQGLSKLIIQLTIVEPLIKAVTGAFGKGGGGFGQLASQAGSFIFSLFGAANGAAFNRGMVTPFANGGVVSSPTFFPMANGTGLMGEAGPEAVMPLKRGKNGKLGVVAAGGTGAVINNITVSIGSIDSEERQRALMRELEKTIKATARQTLSDELTRNGGAFRRAYA